MEGCVSLMENVEKSRKIVRIIPIIARVYGRRKRTRAKVHVLPSKYYPYEKRTEKKTRR